ncbi:MAG: SpoIIE family protein phosphatase [Flavobacteriales bacterium]|nr:SpoIIE family protein phosphatase [Flavobacteriales bacterium]
MGSRAITADDNLEQLNTKEDFFRLIYKRSDKLIEKFLIGYLLFGFAISFYYDTFAVGFIVGPLIVGLYFLSKILFKDSKLNQYIAASGFALFMAQFIYQMHGLFEMHFFAFIGATMMITYQNWKTVIPLAAIVSIHHLSFAFVQMSGIEEIYFTQVTWDTTTFVFHIGLAVVIFFICGLWSFELEKRTSQNIMNILEMKKLNAQIALQKKDLQELNESLEIKVQDRTKELAKKNKSILASINYARKIQTALIPKVEEMREHIPELSMFYKPKDVVSGDFPYYFMKDGHLYIAVFDCTGHGVPGAMLSIIGHLLLDKILNSNQLLEPGEALNLLHKDVVYTLKQDSAHQSDDGMDVALCRISPDKKEVLYSGAHRPLFHISNGELKEYKGSRFPIGGIQYKGKNSFETHSVKILPKDTFFFFSDGFSDQFNEEDIKYGSKRMRDLIKEIANKNIDVNSAIEVFDKEYHDWLGKSSQVDDVILVGMKF